ncbi:TauD/TfdA family dioxygenase [Saccharothrix longispora]|uniref:TauD/TfdA family dioxygenase n=1 Tax=Saccharothrix longispora TaxID=33920 RepID=UPI0028FD366E|nr:TauD/TfdA family dioxygenase [Saccharothrix longispora]MDU0294210.1 TauD/TfdA family dioxygenase [Saccharothrix longispora]
MDAHDVPVLTADDPEGLRARRDSLTDALTEHGAVIVRGLDFDGPASFAACAAAVTDDLIPEREGFAPRDVHSGHVYSSTHWPSNQPMCLHHEMSHARQVPTKLVLGYLRPADTGGATGLADAAAVLDALPAELVDRFARHGWRLSRTYQPLLGTQWSDAFGTTDRAEVDRYCAANDIDHIWLNDGGLRTTQVRPAVMKHPGTGTPCWFNQIAFLNEHTMDPAVRDYLISELGPDGLPFTTSAGDGSPVTPQDVDVINQVYEDLTVHPSLRAGDLMVVDNIRSAHSREAYTGDRDVLVALGDPVRHG